MVVCRFFQQGRCLQGDMCRFEHPKPALAASTFPSPNPLALSFVPSAIENPQPCVFFQRGTCKYGQSCKHVHDLVDVPVADRRSRPVCTFFLRNACSKGYKCSFSHPVGTNRASAQTETTTPSSPLHQENNSNNPSSVPTQTLSNQRTVAGADVIFSEGATVSKITVPADFSTVALSDIPAIVSPGDIRNILTSLGTTWTEDIKVVYMKSNPGMLTKSAELRVNDGGRLYRSIVSVKPELSLHGSKLHIKPIQVGSSEAGINRLQVAGVTCTWYNPSTTATLTYGSSAHASRVFTILDQNASKIRGRQPTFARREGFSTILVGNLDISTDSSDLKRYLGGNAALNVEIRSEFHGISKQALQLRVKNLLEQQGLLVEWKVSTQPGVAKVKAYAKFTNHYEAAQATQKLNGSRIDPSIKDILHVQHVISVKLPVSQRVLKAIKPQLHALAETLRSKDHVMIKAYDGLLKPYTQIRISGQEKASVARAKIQVEALLAGTVARAAKQPLAQRYFFHASSTTFLDKAMKLYGVLIICDHRKAMLRLYGEDKSIEAAQQALESKIVEIESQSKVIVLDSRTLATAMRGGLQLLVATLGKDNIKLDVTSNPKRVLVNGSERDVELVRSTLQSPQLDLLEVTANLNIRKDDDSVCAVCWTQAEEPLATSCGHTYCTACFDSQASSTSEFPVRCLGESGACNTPFALPELRRLLAGNTFETLLETSLNTFIRSHPKKFQYCSTPDCDRFYRVSQEGDAIAFNCDHCLTSICTACHTGAHDGVSCDEVKAGRDGTDEFAQWKSKNDVRDCPACAAPIQKSEGCDHMTCKSCGAHICWQCMKVFEQGPDVYAHMTKDHKGNWGLGWVPQDFE
jgi:hypothetical protein